MSLFSALSGIPVVYYGAIAAAILLLAWSVDNLIQKRIASTQRVLSEYRSAQLQANYQRSVLHYIADIRAALNEITPNFPKDTKRDECIPMEFQAINSGKNKIITDATLRMQDFGLAAEIRAGTFAAIYLPEDIQRDIDAAVRSWSNYTSQLSVQLGKINDFIQGVMLRKYGGKIPSLEEFQARNLVEDKPTPQDITELERLYDQFWQSFGTGGEQLLLWDQSLDNAINRAADFVIRKQNRLSLVSNVIGSAYVFLFLAGSILSIIAAILSASTGSS